jgi:hypothetical protein
MEDEPDDAQEGADICKESLEAATDGGRDQPIEGAMLVHNDGAIMRLWERLVVVWREDVRFILVAAGSQTQVDHELLSSPDAEVGVDEGNLLTHQLLLYCHISISML